MPKKIFPNERREWLERYNSGESEAAIAKSAHRDVRTVKKCIALARQERDIYGARVELLKSVLRQHHDRLLNVIRDMKAALVLPPHDLWRAWKEDGSIPVLSFIGITATYKTDKGWIVSLAVEDRPEWELVKEHLAGDPMLSSLNACKKALMAYIEARVSLEVKSAKLLKKKTGYELVEVSMDHSAVPPFINSYPTLDLIYQVVLNRVLGFEEKTKFEDMVTVDKGRGAVKYGRGTYLAEVPGKEDKCMAAILAALEELLVLEEAKKIGQTHEVLEEAMIKARRAADEILLLEMVPGECRVCRRLGT
jgi:hypothetical protein